MSLFSKLVGIFLGDTAGKFAGKVASKAVGAAYGKKSSKSESFIDKVKVVPYDFAALRVDRPDVQRQGPRRFTEGLAGIGDVDIQDIYRLYGPMILEYSKRTNIFVPALVQPVDPGVGKALSRTPRRSLIG
jgi:hypothetical protein